MTKGLDAILEGSGAQPAGSVPLDFGPMVGNPFNILPAPSIARVEGQNGDSQTWVVTLDVITSPDFDYANFDLLGGGLVRQRCLLTWGQDAIRYNAELDWRPCSFLVHGSYVDVSAIVTQPTVTPLGVRFSASICPAEISQIAGQAPGGPTSTIITDGIPSGGVSASIVVPLRARAVRIYNRFGVVMAGVLRPATCDLRQFPSLALATQLATVRVGISLGGDVAEWIPLVWGTRVVQITNTDGLFAFSAVLEFLIDVG